MISDIRSYFDTWIKEVDPLVIPWETDLFGNNDQSKPRAEKYYNLVIGNNNPLRDGNSHWDNYNVTLDIFAAETRDVLSSFDAVYDKAIQIKNELINWKNYNDVLNDIEFTLAEPTEEESNDNVIKIRLNFIVRFNYNLS